MLKRSGIVVFLIAFGGTSTAVPNVECPNGFGWRVREGACFAEQMVSREEVCPAESWRTDDKCLITSLARIECAEGSQYLGDLRCQVAEIRPGKMVCPEGSVPKDAGCYVGGQLKYCPVGSSMTADGHCRELLPKVFFCPTGFTDAGELCLQTEVIPLQKLCPAQAVFDKTKSKCIATLKSEPECPVGYTDEGRECAKYLSDVDMVCPDSYLVAEDVTSCVKITRTDLVPRCPAGWRLLSDGGSLCEIFRPAEVVAFCGEGGELVGDMCRVKTFLEPIVKCPIGYARTDSSEKPQCERRRTYDCSYTERKCVDEPKRFFPYAAAPPANGKMWFAPYTPPVKIRKLRSSIYYHGPTGAVSPRQSYAPPVAECNYVEVVQNKTCEDTQYTVPSPVCEEGKMEGDKCAVEMIVKAESKCLGRVNAVTGACVLRKTAKPTMICPEGYSRAKGEEGRGKQESSCQQVNLVAASLVCPKGTNPFNGRCAVLAPKTCRTGACATEVALEPHDGCPTDFWMARRIHSAPNASRQIASGFYVATGKGKRTTYKFVPYSHTPAGASYALKNGHRNHDGGFIPPRSCVRKNYSLKNSKCPEGALPEDETKCAKSVDAMFAGSDGVVSPQFLCSLGFAVTPTGECVRTTTLGATAMCPSGFEPILDTELCAKEVQSALRCPENSHEMPDGRCVVRVKALPRLLPADGQTVHPPKNESENAETRDGDRDEQVADAFEEERARSIAAIRRYFANSMPSDRWDVQMV